jgi:hypothetical protein
MRDPQFPFEQAQLRINPNLLLATHDYPERRRRHSMKNSWQGGTSNNRPLLILPFHKPEKMKVYCWNLAHITTLGVFVMHSFLLSQVADAHAAAHRKNAAVHACATPGSTRNVLRIEMKPLQIS